MSGGVDSSVAAALLKEQGYDVLGVTMQIWPSYAKASEGKPGKPFGGCCGINEINDAKEVCQVLGIPHYTVNYREEFKKHVIQNFIDEYKNGRTPNPCIRCNEFMKFKLLIKKGEELGCGFIATGHYANIRPSPCPSDIPLPEGEGFHLLKGKDQRKDQSYVLYMMSQESLSKTLFPMGELTKDEARKSAKSYKLPVHDKKESQEICFIEDDNYGRFLGENIPEAIIPGDILDQSGSVVGKHKGIIFYTIGQKKGIGAHKVRKFVTKIDVKNNVITIGDNSDLMKDSLTADNLTFTSGIIPEGKIEVAAKIRYNSKEEPAVLEVIDNIAHVQFKEKQRAITPGQSVVFYGKDEVLGGGIIR
ncbi:MAG: tRNA 2-thiouridine(34) synthase MnmA [Candidatus Saganbacteria bacterium]|nr:tRNA 2-thiouridine(34) synthase MnmA [Candidatus Saganbacteria bacterium]